MSKLILFDIDGTLITARGAFTTGDRFSAAVNNLYDLNVRLSWDHLGLTDQLIMKRLLKEAGWDDARIKLAMPELVKELDRVHRLKFKPADVKLLPGVKKLLSVLHEHQQVTLGLITGNLETVAQRKLSAVGIYDYFKVGGFGSDDHLTRADLIKIAIQKANFNDPASVYVVGDTARDIFAANDAGIKHSIGVVNGFRDTQELIDAGAEAVFEDLSDTPAVLSVFGVSKPNTK